jgi:hypothetical protein
MKRRRKKEEEGIERRDSSRPASLSLPNHNRKERSSIRFIQKKQYQQMKRFQKTIP